MGKIDSEEKWNEVLEKIKLELDEHEIAMWFNLQYAESSDHSLTLNVPSAFHKDHLVKNYKNYIESKLEDICGLKLQIKFEVAKNVSNNKKVENKVSLDEKNIKGSPISLANSFRHPQLRPELNFNNFIIGNNSSFAANAAIAIAKNLGTQYNPFLIYGGVGLGKTHLMQSIGNEIWNDNNSKNTKIIYVTAEEFTNEFIQSLQNNVQNSFKNKYRFVDLLLIDDIQFFQGKAGTQEELFHTFNALYNAKKQLVFTCDRHVSELKDFTDRLTSRFTNGLNIDLKPPDFETSCAILRKKVQNHTVNVPDDVIELIAKNITSNVRDLEAALGKLIAYSQLVRKEISMEVAENQLRDIFRQAGHKAVSIESILRIVADHYKLTASDLKGKKRTKNIVFPRQIAMFIARSITEYSTTELGYEFGNRDHTTVMHSYQKIENTLKVDPSLESVINELIRKINTA